MAVERTMASLFSSQTARVDCVGSWPSLFNLDCLSQKLLKDLTPFEHFAEASYTEARLEILDILQLHSYASLEF